MVPVGVAYRAAGPISVRSFLAILGIGGLSAFLAAAIDWTWETSGIPRLILVTSYLQGFVIGWIMAFAIGRLKLRHFGSVAGIGIACAVGSVLLVHYWHHERIVSRLTSQARAEIRRDRTLTTKEQTAKLKATRLDPDGFANRLLIEKSGHSGLLGSMMLRSQAGISIDGIELIGWPFWVLWAVEALIVAGTVVARVQARACAPFCEDCGAWCVQRTGDLVLPGEAFIPLTVAIRTGNVNAVLELRTNPPESDGRSLSGTILHSCPLCDQTFADAWNRKLKGYFESRPKPVILDDRVRVSAQMVALLRVEPDSLVDDEYDDEVESDD